MLLRDITQKRVTSGGAHFRAWQHSSEKILQRWRNFSNTVFNVTGPEIESKPSAPIETSSTTPTGRNISEW